MSSTEDKPILYGPERKPWAETISDLAKSSAPDGKLLVTPPSKDPLEQYEKVYTTVSGSLYQVTSSGHSKSQQEAAQKETLDLMHQQQKNFLGYQVGMELSKYVSPISPYLSFHTNNAGDPFSCGSMTMNTKWMECNVLDYYASLWNAKWPHDTKDPDAYWGYVLSMGATEGNLYSAWNARDYLSGKFLFYDPSTIERTILKSKSGKKVAEIPNQGFTHAQSRVSIGTDGQLQNENAFSPVVFYSEDTHYSHIKATQAIDIPTFFQVGSEKYPKENPLNPGQSWPPEVPSKDGPLGPGSIDIDALAKLVDFFTGKGHPIFIILNYGSTFKGSYDNVEAIGETLIPILKKNHMYEREIVLEDGRRETRRGFWIHIDGALGATYMPFLEMAAKSGLRGDLEPGPVFDFRLDFVASIVTSGHKWIGAPWPCGIYMTRNKYRIKPPQNTPTIIGSPDTTFAGSRNAVSSALLWTYISTHSYEVQVKKALHCLDVARYTYTKLKDLEKELGMDLWVAHSHKYALTVHFKKPRDDIVFKYTLSNEQMLINGEEHRAYSHVYLMDHVTYEKIDELIGDLRQPEAFPEQEIHDLPSKIQEYVVRWLVATRLRKQRAKKDKESGIVLPDLEPRLLSLFPSHGRGYK